MKRIYLARTLFARTLFARTLFARTLFARTLFTSITLACTTLCAQKGAPVKQDTSGTTGSVSLPAPLKTRAAIEDCIAARRSVRRFDSRDLTLAEISTLCWACQGITDTARGYRAAPSAGATFPLDVYLVKKDGVFRYLPDGHRLVRVSAVDERKNLSRAAFNQASLAEAAVDFVLTAVPERTSRRYGDRAVRYIDIESGHAAQNLHLEAVALGLGSVPIGAFAEGDLKKILSLGPTAMATYIIPVGHPQSGQPR